MPCAPIKQLHTIPFFKGLKSCCHCRRRKAEITTSHLILHVVDTEATLDFWCRGLAAELESDEELAAPALDAIFGREGVRIRDTFIRAGGTRIHTIETLDRKRERVEKNCSALPDLYSLWQETTDLLSRTNLHDFSRAEELLHGGRRRRSGGAPPGPGPSG